MTNFDPFLYGKDQTEGIVSVDVKDGKAYYYFDDGTVKTVPHTYWILYARQVDNDCIALRGAAHYSYAKKFATAREFFNETSKLRSHSIDHHVVWNLSEQHMIKQGVTCFLGQSPQDVSVLSFDIETTGLKLDDEAKVLLIACTYRKGDTVERKLFAYDEYETQKEMIYAFCEYIRTLNPSFIVGHNIFNFDLPYLQHCGGPLKLGRDGSPAKFANRPSKIRKDQNTFYEYYDVAVFGRQVIDTFNLAIKYDVARRYESYGLKQIIRQEGLERQGRQHYDASTIYRRYTDPAEWAKIKEYATDDGDDALKLFDLMIPAYFYFAQNVPMCLQQIINRNSGSQVNAFLIRNYLQMGFGIPKADEPIRYEGGISYGEPGIYRNCFKVDVASLYPSIMLHYKVQNEDKDPEGIFLEMVRKFTESRLENKRLAAETGERKYKDKSDAEKIFINSAYGFMNAKGLNFNYPEGAKRVCRLGQHILTKGINFATRSGYKIANADTDSFMVADFTSDSGAFVSDLNSLFPSAIKWEDDGQYRSVLILKAKNYVLLSEDGKISYKGAAVKATTKEPALQNFIQEVIACLLEGKTDDDVLDIYNRYACDIHRIDAQSIKSWCSKKTVSDKILRAARTQEARIKQAIDEAGLTVKEGEKIYVFYEEDDRLSVAENFKGVYSKEKLATKLHNTISVFDSVLDVRKFPKYQNKGNRKKFDELRFYTNAHNQGLLAAKAQLSLFSSGD